MNLSEDSLLNGRVKLLQPERGYRIAIDSLFLAAAIPAKHGDRILELGSGTGAASICLAARIPDIQVTGLEQQLDMVEMATKSIDLNNLKKRVYFFHGNLLFPPKHISARSFDHVMANPPYFKTGSAVPSPNLQRKLANIEGKAELCDWIKFSIEIAKCGGTITFVHRYDRREEVVSALAEGAGEIVVYPLWPLITGRKAKRVLVQGKKGVKGRTKYSSGMVLYDEKGNYTFEANGILRDADELNL